jgi:hypothetical protein
MSINECCECGLEFETKDDPEGFLDRDFGIWLTWTYTCLECRWDNEPLRYHVEMTNESRDLR